MLAGTDRGRACAPTGIWLIPEFRHLTDVCGSALQQYWSGKSAVSRKGNARHATRPRRWHTGTFFLLSVLGPLGDCRARCASGPGT